MDLGHKPSIGYNLVRKGVVIQEEKFAVDVLLLLLALPQFRVEFVIHSNEKNMVTN